MVNPFGLASFGLASDWDCRSILFRYPSARRSFYFVNGSAQVCIVGDNTCTLEILSICCFLANGDGEVSLSTAKSPETDYLKPTSLHQKTHVGRILNVVKQPQTYSQSTSVFFRARDKPPRKSRSEIWKWDYWCQLQPKIGSCHEKLQRFYYDAQIDQCVKFTYSGCQGNENNFDTSIECDRHCKGAALSERKDIDAKSRCALQPNAGLCVATLIKYYYDINEDTCKIFVFGGCGGNENMFDAKYKCIKQCRTK